MKKYRGKKLLVLGDSIMFGSGNDGYGVGEYLAARLGFTLLKYCVGGARTGRQDGKSWIVEQTRSAIENRETPDLIVFDGFTNDCNMTDGKTCDIPFEGIERCESFDVFNVKGTDTNFTDCFESIAASLKKYFPDSKTLFVRPHKMGRRGEKIQIKYGERAAEICKTYNIPVVDIYSDSGLDTFDAVQRDKYTNDSYGWGRGDCTHPNAAGYEKFYVPLIEKAVEKLFEGENNEGFNA